MRLVFCTFYKLEERYFCLYISKEKPAPRSFSLPLPSLSAFPYSSAPAKECEFIDLIFIGKTKALSCRVYESVVWVCMCSPQPQTGGKVHGRGLKAHLHTAPLQVTGVSRCGVLSQASGATHLACSGLPTPCPLGWAQGRGLRWTPARDGIRAGLPPTSLSLMHFPHLKSSV